MLVVGAGGLERELRDVGLEVVTAGHAATRMHQEGIDGWAAAGAPDAVVTGLDPNLTYLRLAAAADCVRVGARFIATNRDPVYPTERGLRRAPARSWPRSKRRRGSRRCRSASPSPQLLELAAEAVGRTAGEAVMIGDGMETDLAAARAVGASCVLMLTGVAKRDEVDALADHERPMAVAADATELAAILDGSRARDGPRREWSAGTGAQLGDPRGPAIECRAERLQRSLVGEGDVEGLAVDGPQLRHRQPDGLDGLDVLLGQRDVGHRGVVGAERHRDPGTMEPGQRMVRHRRHDAGLPVRGRAQVEADAAGM